MADDSLKHGPDTDYKIWRSRVEHDLERAKADYRQLRHTVYGNGEPGLTETVRAIEANQGELKKELHGMRVEIRGFQEWLRKTLVAVIKWFVGIGTPILVGVVVWAVSQGALG